MQKILKVGVLLAVSEAEPVYEAYSNKIPAAPKTNKVNTVSQVTKVTQEPSTKEASRADQFSPSSPEALFQDPDFEKKVQAAIDELEAQSKSKSKSKPIDTFYLNPVANIATGKPKPFNSKTGNTQSWGMAPEWLVPDWGSNSTTVGDHHASSPDIFRVARDGRETETKKTLRVALAMPDGLA